MAASAITRKNILLAGTTQSFTAANVDGNFCDNDGATFLEIKNTGSQITVTFDSVRKSDYNTDEDVAVIIPATTGDVLIGPFPVRRFTRTLSWTYTAVTGVTVSVMRASA